MSEMNFIYSKPLDPTIIGQNSPENKEKCEPDSAPSNFSQSQAQQQMLTQLQRELSVKLIKKRDRSLDLVKNDYIPEPERPPLELGRIEKFRILLSAIGSKFCSLFTLHGLSVALINVTKLTIFAFCPISCVPYTILCKITKTPSLNSLEDIGSVFKNLGQVTMDIENAFKALLFGLFALISYDQIVTFANLCISDGLTATIFGAHETDFYFCLFLLGYNTLESIYDEYHSRAGGLDVDLR